MSSRSKPKPDLLIEHRCSRRLCGCGEKALHYVGAKPTGGLLAEFFERTRVYDKTLVEHLRERGYDITTLRFSIRKVAPVVLPEAPEKAVVVECGAGGGE